MKLSKDMQGRRLSAPVFIRSIEEKLLSGEYSLEEAPCVCGSSEEIELSKVDRDQLPHRLVICKECALVRANPRLTAESFAKYCSAEYRGLNTGRLLVPDITSRLYLVVDDRKSGFEAQYTNGETLIKWLDDADVGIPETVIEIGCRWGGTLAAFQAAGSKVIGCEVNDEMRQAVCQPNWVYQNIEQLIAAGEKADLIIMQESLDHFSDLREMIKVKSLLKPEGLLYVHVPGFFSKDPNKMVRFGRNYHFCVATLDYVMARCGFSQAYRDEEVLSLWKHHEMADMVLFPNKPVDWVKYSLDYLLKPDGESRILPPFEAQCKFTKKLLHTNARANLKHKIPDLAEITEKYSGPLVVVGGGPSVDGQVETIKALKKDGLPVIAIARMNPWCLDHGIVPNFVISLDCSAEQEPAFERLHQDTTYLIASFSRPSIVERLLTYKGYIYDTQDSRELKKIRAQCGYSGCTIVNAGGTVVLNALSLGMNLGFTDFHVFGLDLLVKDARQTHAKGIAGKSIDFDFMEVEINGEDILTTPGFLEFANQTLDFCSAGHDAGLLKSIKFYGDSLINRMWDGQWHEEEGTDVNAKL